MSFQHISSLRLVHVQDWADVPLEEELLLTLYKYENIILGMTGFVWRCGDQTSFQSGAMVTDYHGDFSEIGTKLVLSFNCRGSEYPLRTSVLFLTDRDRKI